MKMKVVRWSNLHLEWKEGHFASFEDSGDFLSFFEVFFLGPRGRFPDFCGLRVTRGEFPDLNPDFCAKL